MTLPLPRTRRPTPRRRRRRRRKRSNPRPRSSPTADARAGPVRTCIGCRRRFPQAKLARVVATPAGRLIISRTAPGRGAWLCGVECARKAARRKAFGRALRAPVGESAVRELLEQVESSRRT